MRLNDNKKKKKCPICGSLRTVKNISGFHCKRCGYIHKNFRYRCPKCGEGFLYEVNHRKHIEVCI